MLLEYPPTCSRHAAFFATTLPAHALGLLCVPWQRMHVTFLDVVHPSADEQANPDAYAERLRTHMAKLASKEGEEELVNGVVTQALKGATVPKASAVLINEVVVPRERSWRQDGETRRHAQHAQSVADRRAV